MHILYRFRIQVNGISSGAFFSHSASLFFSLSAGFNLSFYRRCAYMLGLCVCLRASTTTEKTTNWAQRVNNGLCSWVLTREKNKLSTKLMYLVRRVQKNITNKNDWRIYERNVRKFVPCHFSHFGCFFIGSIFFFRFSLVLLDSAIFVLLQIIYCREKRSIFELLYGFSNIFIRLLLLCTLPNWFLLIFLLLNVWCVKGTEWKRISFLYTFHWHSSTP